MKSCYLFSVTDLSSNPTSFSQLLASLFVHDLMKGLGEASTPSITSAAIQHHNKITINFDFCVKMGDAICLSLINHQL